MNTLMILGGVLITVAAYALSRTMHDHARAP
jgi:hypothetical protein